MLTSSCLLSTYSLHAHEKSDTNELSQRHRNDSHCQCEAVTLPTPVSTNLSMSHSLTNVLCYLYFKVRMSCRNFLKPQLHNYELLLSSLQREDESPASFYFCIDIYYMFCGTTALKRYWKLHFPVLHVAVNKENRVFCLMVTVGVLVEIMTHPAGRISTRSPAVGHNDTLGG